jgi:hypothetical protein
MEHHPGEKGSFILDTEGASSWRHREPHPGYRRSLIMENRESNPGDIGRLSLETEGASSWRQRAPHPGDIGSHILET